MPSHGSTTKKCVVCHAQLSVACKTCKTCKAEQPRKLRLKRKMDKFDQKRESWVHTHQKNRTTSHIRDEAYMLLEKLQALGVKAALFISRPGRKPHAWMSEVLTPRCQLTETSSVCLQRMKEVYDVVVQGWSPQGAAGQEDEPPHGPPMAQTDIQVALALLDPRPASVGPPKSSLGQSGVLLEPSAQHVTREPQSYNVGKELYSREEPPAAYPVYLEKGGLREIKTEAECSPTSPSAAAISSQDIKRETEDIRSTSDHTAGLRSSPLLLVTVTDAGLAGAMKDDLRETGDTQCCGEMERERRDLGPEMPSAAANVSGATSKAAPIQRGVKEEIMEPMYFGPASKWSGLVEYENTDATTFNHDAAELLLMRLETRVPQTIQTSDTAPPSRPSANCDLDTMDLDQLRREKIKMQIKVLRLQEEYYTQKIKGNEN